MNECETARAGAYWSAGVRRLSELKSRGITELDPLQERAVRAGLFREGKNFVIMPPTSSGKTLVAELCALYHAVNRSGAVFVTSHKALAYEKYLTFRDSYSRRDSLHFHTSITTGDEVTDESAIEHVPLTVATYEKWYYTLIGSPRLIDQKSLLIVDELQTLGDENRGDRLEALITLVRTKAPATQIIGLSATFPNADAVARWLDATMVTATRRPVALVEEIWWSRGTVSIDRDNAPALAHTSTTHPSLDTTAVVRQIELEGQVPAIVFCVTKDQAENLARSAAQGRQPRPDAQMLVNELDEVSESNPTIRTLRQILPKGIAFHNANLGHDERRLVESAFRSRTEDLLFATPTLSAGVNLPVKTVVFDTCYRRWVQGTSAQPSI